MHAAFTASARWSLAAFSPSLEMETQFAYPGGAIFAMSAKPVAMRGKSWLKLGPDTCRFIHAWSGQSGSGFFPQASSPRPPSLPEGDGGAVDAEGAVALVALGADEGRGPSMAALDAEAAVAGVPGPGALASHAETAADAARAKARSVQGRACIAAVYFREAMPKVL